MVEYRVLWRQFPLNHNPERVLFVEAYEPKDAGVIARNHIEREFGITGFLIEAVEEFKPVPPGRVL